MHYYTISEEQLLEWRKDIEQATETAELKAKLEHLKQVVIHDRIEWEDFPPTSQLAFADLLKD